MLEGVSYRTYGIRCTEQEIADLTRDAAALKPLLDYCNRLKLSPLHLKDVAEDFVGPSVRSLRATDGKIKRTAYRFS